MQPFAISQKLYTLLLDGKRQQIKAGKGLITSERGKAIHLVATGFIKRYLELENGQRSVQVVYGPGDIFSLTQLFRVIYGQEIYQGRKTYLYDAMTDAEVYTLPSSILLKHIEADPMLYRDLFAQAGRRIQFNIQHLENAAINDTYKRIAHQLAFYGRQFGVNRGSSIRLAMPLTAVDLAEGSNVPLEDAQKAFDKLVAEDLIECGKYIVIPDFERLELTAWEDGSPPVGPTVLR